MKMTKNLPKHRKPAHEVEQIPVVTTRASTEEIARAELDHRMRFPRLYGISPDRAGWMRENYEDALMVHRTAVASRSAAPRVTGFKWPEKEVAHA